MLPIDGYDFQLQTTLTTPSTILIHPKFEISEKIRAEGYFFLMGSPRILEKVVFIG